MTQARSIKFGLIAVLLGDGAVPTEAFTAPCGVTSVDLTTNVETNTTNVMDCDDVDAASWLEIDEVSRQFVASGAGLLTREALDDWRDWNLAGGLKNVRVFTDIDNADGGGYYQGPALLTAYTETGERGQKWQNSFTITFDGKPTFTAA